MVKAIWNGTIIAESDTTIMVEGNHYFPNDSVNQAYLRPSNRHTSCYWKGLASYYDLEVNGKSNPGAAWYYAEPSEAAQHIKNHVAFWHGVEILE